MNAVSTSELTKKYQMGDITVEALKGVDLEVEQGEFVAIMGPSGSGKSTLMHLLGLLDRPTSGEVEIAGRKVSEFTERQRAKFRLETVGFVFQFYSMLSGMEARDDVRLPMLLAGASSKSSVSKSMDSLEKVGLGDRTSHKASELSGGQRQRAAIARAIVNDPELVLADEPTSELDTETSEEVVELFKQISGDGRTVVMVNHEREMAEMADRTIVLEDGEIRDR